MNRTFLSLLLMSCTAFASPISFDYVKVGSFRSQALMDLFGLGSWNGQPLSDTNKPSDYNRVLSVTTNFYVSPSAVNQLFVQVTDVITTQGTWLYGSAMNAAALTGLRVWLPAKGSMQFGTPTFSSEYANPGQALFPGTGSGSATMPLTTTPGYQIDSLASNGAYYIHTRENSEYAFGTWGWVTGTKRISGGGVFQLTFAAATNLLTDVNYRNVQLDAIYGSGLQSIRGEWASSVIDPNLPPTAVPEPSSIVLVGCGILALAWYRRKA